jgi:hypothetical protein
MRHDVVKKKNKLKKKMGTKALKPLAKEENEGEKPLQF